MGIMEKKIVLGLYRVEGLGVWGFRASGFRGLRFRLLQCYYRDC